MKILLLILVLSFSATVSAVDVTHTLDFNTTKIEHRWDDSKIDGYPGDAIAAFETRMNGVGITTWFNSNIGIRTAYGKMNTARELTGGKYSHVAIEFKYIAALELLYKLQVSENLHILAGIGGYLIPTNHLYLNDDNELIGGRSDSDNDTGYIFGLAYNISKHFNVEYRYTHYSQIGDYEYIKGNSLSLVYVF